MALWIGGTNRRCWRLALFDKENSKLKVLAHEPPVLSIDYDNKVVYSRRLEGKSTKNHMKNWRLVFYNQPTTNRRCWNCQRKREFKATWNGPICWIEPKRWRGDSQIGWTRANTLIVLPLLVVVTSVLNLLKPLSVLERSYPCWYRFSILYWTVTMIKTSTKWWRRTLEDHNIRLLWSNC